MKKLIFVYTLILLISVAATAQSAAFNFQGRLNDGTNPANGHYDLQFRLYDAIVGGGQLGPIVSRPNTTLVNGVFSTTLDFGSAAFTNPNSTFIEFSVRNAGSLNAFTILGPRQQLMAVPFAFRSASAANADNATNAQNAQNAVTAATASNAATATNALSLGGVPAANYAKLDVINPGQLIMDGNVRQSVNSYGLGKAMLEMSFSNGNAVITHCYNSATNSTAGGCGFVLTQPLGTSAGVFRINFGFPISNTFVSVSAVYASTSSSTNNSAANYRLFDSTSIEVFTFASGNSADTTPRAFTLILF